MSANDVYLFTPYAVPEDPLLRLNQAYIPSTTAQGGGSVRLAPVKRKIPIYGYITVKSEIQLPLHPYPVQAKADIQTTLTGKAYAELEQELKAYLHLLGEDTNPLTEKLSAKAQLLLEELRTYGHLKAENSITQTQKINAYGSTLQILLEQVILKKPKLGIKETLELINKLEHQGCIPKSKCEKELLDLLTALEDN